MGVLFIVISAVCFCIICGLVAATIPEKRLAISLGLFLERLAAWFLDSRPKCHHCHSRVDRSASICPVCQESLRNPTDDILNAGSKAELEAVLETYAPPVNHDDDILNASSKAELEAVLETYAPPVNHDDGTDAVNKTHGEGLNRSTQVVSR